MGRDPAQCRLVTEQRGWGAAGRGCLIGNELFGLLDFPRASVTCPSIKTNPTCRPGELQLSWLLPSHLSLPLLLLFIRIPALCFPGGSDGKESACNAGDLGLTPGSGRSPGEGNGNLFLYSCLENPHGQRSLVGCSPWGSQRVKQDCVINTLSLVLSGRGISPRAR